MIPEPKGYAAFILFPHLKMIPPASVPPLRAWGGTLTIYNQTMPHRVLDGKTPDQVYGDNLTTRLTAA